MNIFSTLFIILLGTVIVFQAKRYFEVEKQLYPDLTAFDYEGLEEATTPFEDKLDKIKAGMNFIFGNSYLEKEFETTRIQESACTVLVAGVLQGYYDISAQSKIDMTMSSQLGFEVTENE